MREIKVNDNELKCLKILVTGYYEFDEGACLYFRYIAKQTHLEETEVRRAVRSLARKGLAEYHRGLFDEDGMVAGSGYCATKKGADIINEAKSAALDL